MSIEVKLPAFGMGMQDATILAWYRREGERIEMGESLFEIEAAKTTVEVPSPASGVLTRILVQVGSNVPVLAVVGIIDEAGVVAEPMHERPGDAACASAPRPPVASARSGETTAPTAPRATPLATRIANDLAMDLTGVAASGHGGRIQASDLRGADKPSGPVPVRSRSQVQVEPRARRLARELNIQVDAIAGSGPAGRIVEEDVREEYARRAAAAVITPEPAVTAMAVTAAPPPTRSPAPSMARHGMRSVIASRMMSSLHGSAQLTLTSEVDVTALVKLRDYLKGEFALTYTSLFVKACAMALRLHPALNASWSAANGAVTHRDIHIGVAVALEEGLLVPVIRAADSKGLREIASLFASAVSRARAGQLTLEEMSGGSFSVTNLGAWGIDAFTPVLNAPESGILGLGRIRDHLCKVGDGMAWRKTMVLSLTFDHRVIDGVPAARFLKTLAELVAQPEGLLA